MCRAEICCLDLAERKMEYLAAENAYAYVGAGDIKMDKRLTHTGRFVFPSSHYHGLTIGFDMEIAAAALAEEVKIFRSIS